jgi:tetratricopeptide (TPR) repeat protein
VRNTIAQINEAIKGEVLLQAGECTIDFKRIATETNKPRNEWRSVIDYAIVNAWRMAAAYEAMGDLRCAMEFYRLGTYSWPFPWPVYPHRLGDNNISLRDDLVLSQLPAAVSCDRIGMTDRARQLYEWAAEHSRLTDEELAFHGVDQVVWERLPWRAYALACLERWEEARVVAEQADEVARKDRRAQTSESYQSPLKILPVVLALTRFKTEPSEGNRSQAVRMLHPQAIASRAHESHLHALFYLYNLRARHPDLAAPQRGDALSPEGARQTADLCQKWLARQGFILDRTPESLKVLDPLMRPSYEAAPDEEARNGMVALWGSYLGEILREELAGGQWDFEPESPGPALVWDMGVGELRILPYKHVLQILTGKTSQSLYELWQETEQSYVEMGLAARHAD